MFIATDPISIPRASTADIHQDFGNLHSQSDTNQDTTTTAKSVGSSQSSYVANSSNYLFVNLSSDSNDEKSMIETNNQHLIYLHDSKLEHEGANKEDNHRCETDVDKCIHKDLGESTMDIVNFPTKTLLTILAELLDKIVKSNDEAPDCKIALGQTYEKLMDRIQSFSGSYIPSITIYQYLERIHKYCPTSNDVYLSMLICLDRISRKCNSKTRDSFESQPFAMDSFNIHRLIITCAAVCTKFSSDFFYSNYRYSKVGGITLDEMNRLEVELLFLCDFRLKTSSEEIERYGNLVYRFWESNSDSSRSIFKK